MVAKKAGCVPVRRRADGEWEVLLVSASGERGAFVLPKGGVERGEKRKDTAARETLEEAGVVGRLRRGPIGVFEYRRHRVDVAQKMWLLFVDEEISKTDPRWKERNERVRLWVSFDAAHALLAKRKENIEMLTAAQAQLAQPEPAASAPEDE